MHNHVQYIAFFNYFTAILTLLTQLVQNLPSFYLLLHQVCKSRLAASPISATPSSQPACLSAWSCNMQKKLMYKFKAKQFTLTCHTTVAIKLQYQNHNG